MDPVKINKVFLLLGSNKGDRLWMLSEAMKKISFMGEIVSRSSIYETEPWGFGSEENFLNTAVELHTCYSPAEILCEIKSIEIQLGREPFMGGYRSREIDIDILFYDSDIIFREDLVIPHPLIPQRKFALVPLSEIAGDFIHPVANKTISEMLSDCNDISKVTRFNQDREKIIPELPGQK